MTKKTAPIRLSHLTKRYGASIGIDDVSLEIRPGEVFGFLGPNGAGKSTAIRTIMGFIRQSSGSIALFGKGDDLALREARRRIGYLSGDVAIYDSMTGRKFLEFTAKLGHTVDWDYVDQLVERFVATLDRPIKDLSKGNRQKIGLIQALMHQPELLILDEPTTGLDPLMKQVFYDIVREVSSNGATVFVSSHDLGEVQKICDRAGFIRAGKLISIESVSEALKFGARRYTVTFAKKPPITPYRKLTALSDVTIDGTTMRCTVRGEITEFIRLLAQHKPLTLFEQEVELEELFMHYYTDTTEVS